ncbi:MAG: hypothetical protein IT258_06450 [Saprospiraceae bacterium]|nr:hypothetical protein [Saprospiraceae bacterium]
MKGPCHTQKLSIETEYDDGFDVVIAGPPSLAHPLPLPSKNALARQELCSLTGLG